MGKKTKKREKIRKLQERSDRRSAEFLVSRFETLEDELADLLPDLRMFSHYTQILELSVILRLVKGLKKKYRKMSDGCSWQDDED